MKYNTGISTMGEIEEEEEEEEEEERNNIGKVITNPNVEVLLPECYSARFAGKLAWLGLAHLQP